MGLDGVELIMAFEVSFGHAVSDAEAATMRTPGHVVRHFREKLPGGDDSACLHQQGFYTLRAAVQETWQVPRHQIRPSTPWSAVIPSTHVARAWDQLGHRLIGKPLWRWRQPEAYRSTARIGEAIPALCVEYAAALKRPGAGWSEREITHVVVSLVKDQLGVTDVPLDADFVDQLGVN